MAKLTFICMECDLASEIEIVAFSSDGFHIICPSCDHDFWFEAAQQNVKSDLPNALTRHPDCGDPGCCSANPEA